VEKNLADPKANFQEVLKEATLAIRERYDFFEMTLQVEHFTDVMMDCKLCENPA